MKMLQRPYRLVRTGSLINFSVLSLLQNRDDLEDAELETSQISEGMPMVLQGFKDHPLSVFSALSNPGANDVPQICPRTPSQTRRSHHAEERGRQV